MAKSLKLADEVLNLVRREADLHSRSLAGQATHWIKIGRAIENSGNYDHARITAALAGEIDTTKLHQDEEAPWLDAFTEKMGQASEAEKSFYMQRQTLGQGVGLDAGGNLIYAEGDAAA